MNRLLVAVLPLMVAVLAVGVMACDQGHEVTYENTTSHRLTVYRFGRADFEIGPSETKDYTVLEFSGPMAVEARNEEGTVIYSESFTWDELRAADWKIVITAVNIPAEATPTPE